jgi:hypothetical protein
MFVSDISVRVLHRSMLPPLAAGLPLAVHSDVEDDRVVKWRGRLRSPLTITSFIPSASKGDNRILEPTRNSLEKVGKPIPYSGIRLLVLTTNRAYPASKRFVAGIYASTAA